jgi:hypothetical protein
MAPNTGSAEILGVLTGVRMEHLKSLRDKIISEYKVFAIGLHFMTPGLMI